MPAENTTTQPVPPPSEEALALARLRQKGISHPLQQCQLTMYVPLGAVGSIIGRGGRTILSTQQEAKRRSLGHDIGVRIHVVGGISNSGGNNAVAASTTAWNCTEYQQQELQPSSQQSNGDNDVDDWIPVTIRGDPIGCLEASKLIIPLVDRPQDPTYLAVIFDVPIHQAKHNLLVGKGGIVLAYLSATYETRIMIPPNEFMSNVESNGNIWEQRVAEQQSKANDAGAAMLFGGEAGCVSEMLPQTNTTVGNLDNNIIQLEGEIDNVEQCLVRMLQIVASEEKVEPTGLIADCVESITPQKKQQSEKSQPTEKTVASAIIVANTSIPSKIWRSVQRKTNAKIQRKDIKEEDAPVPDAEPPLMNENTDEVEGEDYEDDVVNDDMGDKEESVVRPHSKFIITGKNEQTVRKACSQLEKMLGLEVGSTEITVEVVTVEASPIGKGESQPDSESATSSKRVRKRRGKKKSTAQPD